MDGPHWSPLGFILGVVTSAGVGGWLATGAFGVSSAPVLLEPGRTNGLREAGVREAIGRLEDSLERCCAARASEAPDTVCRCGLGDTLGDLLRGFALGSGSLLLAVAAWACRCCGWIASALPVGARSTSRPDPSEATEADATVSVAPEDTAPPPTKRRAGRGGALAHLAADSSQFA